MSFTLTITRHDQ